MRDPSFFSSHFLKTGNFHSVIGGSIPSRCFCGPSLPAQPPIAVRQPEMSTEHPPRWRPAVQLSPQRVPSTRARAGALVTKDLGVEFIFTVKFLHFFFSVCIFLRAGMFIDSHL